MSRDFLGRMQRGKDAAIERRNRGYHVGAAAKGWNVSRPGPETDQEAAELLSRKRWEFALSDFIEGLRFDLYGDQWEGL